MIKTSKKNIRCGFIGGKQLGVNCLNHLLENMIKPQFVLANLDDDGEDNPLHQSLIKFSEKHNLNVMRGNLRSPKIIKSIGTYQPEIIFCIGGTRLIPPEILSIPKLGCLNIHPSLLPKYRGRYSTAHALFNGETQTGVTLHWIDEGIDSGPIIIQSTIGIDPNDTAKSLYNKFVVAGGNLFLEFLTLWLSGNPIPSNAQNNSLATYYPKGLPNNEEIEWTWPGKKIRNFIRSMLFDPYPPINIAIDKKTLVIISENLLTDYPKTPQSDCEIDWAWPGEKIYSFIQSISAKPFPFIKFSIGHKNLVIVDSDFKNQQIRK